MVDARARPTSTLLINEPPLQVLPTLACQVGLNEAIVLQQLHYWLQRSAHEREGQWWVYSTYEQWQAQFPWWSIRTLKDLLPSLEARGLIRCASYNRRATDRTKWYTINYDHPQLAGNVPAEPASGSATGPPPRPSSPLLIAEPPLQVLPTLARTIGLGPAIVLQQLHYRVQRSKHRRDDRSWVYNTYEEWQTQFPWWSIRTLKRLFQDLEREGAILTGTFNRSALDRTKWYTLDYSYSPLSGAARPTPATTQLPSGNPGTIAECKSGPMVECEAGTMTECGSGPMAGQDWPDRSAKVDLSNHETSSENPHSKLSQTSHKNTTGPAPTPDSVPVTPALVEDRVVALVTALHRCGITMAVARRLVALTDAATLARQLDIFAWLRAADPDDPHLTPGRLRRMIEEDWAPPTGYLPASERARREALATDRQRRATDAWQAEQERHVTTWAAEDRALAAVGLLAEDQVRWRIIAESPRRLAAPFRDALFYAPRDAAPPALIFRQRDAHIAATAPTTAPERAEIERRLREHYPAYARRATAAALYLNYDELLAAVSQQALAAAPADSQRPAPTAAGSPGSAGGKATTRSRSHPASR